jgi:hypothetical protein
MTSHEADAVVQPSHPQRSASFLALAGLFTFACIGAIEPLPNGTGTIMVTVSTAGIDLDADGYILTIDSKLPQAVDLNAVVTVGSLVFGKHVVRLDGLSANCYYTTGNQRSVKLVNRTSASPVAISFSVLCVDDGTHVDPWSY